MSFTPTCAPKAAIPLLVVQLLCQCVYFNCVYFVLMFWHLPKHGSDRRKRKLVCGTLFIFVVILIF